MHLYQSLVGWHNICVV